MCASDEHVRADQRLAQILQLGLARRRGPARRRERRVVLDALDDASSQCLGVGCPAKADRIIPRHVSTGSGSG